MIKDQINQDLLKLAERSDEVLADIYRRIDQVCMYNSDRILSAFIENKVSYSDFSDINGYGNYDAGRDKLEKMFADVLGCEDALVRPQIMSGTNALFLTFSALLKHGDTMISLTGTPYDSLQEMIGLTGDSAQSLKAHGVRYEQIDLVNDEFDEETIVSRLKEGNVRLVEIQRSRGYSSRASLCIAKIGHLIQKIREVNKDVIIMVDNCYGELVEEREPGHVGADVGGFPHEEPRRRHRFHGRLYCRQKGPGIYHCGTADRSRHRQGTRCELQSEQFLLQRAVRSSRRSQERDENSCLRFMDAGTAGIPQCITEV